MEAKNTAVSYVYRSMKRSFYSLTNTPSSETFYEDNQQMILVLSVFDWFAPRPAAVSFYCTYRHTDAVACDHVRAVKHLYETSKYHSSVVFAPQKLWYLIC